MKTRNLFAIIASCCTVAISAIAFSIISSVNADSEDTQLSDNNVILGDADLNGTLNVRDCAFIASRIAKGRANELPSNSDYNKDGKINVRDAASIAHDIAYIGKTEITETLPAETYISTTTTTTVTTTTVSNTETTVETTTTPVTTETKPVTTEHVHNYVAFYVEEPIYEKHYICDTGNYDITVMYYEYVEENGEIAFSEWKTSIFNPFIYNTYGTSASTGFREKWVQVGTETIFKWGECECGAYTTVEEICTKP